MQRDPWHEMDYRICEINDFHKSSIIDVWQRRKYVSALAVGGTSKCITFKSNLNVGY